MIGYLIPWSSVHWKLVGSRRSSRQLTCEPKMWVFLPGRSD
jgi:hypothetical protein